MQRQSGHTRTHRTSGCAFSIRVAITMILALFAASGFFRFWSVLLILFKGQGQAIIAPPTPGGSDVRILLAALQAKLGRRIEEAHEPDDEPGSEEPARCAARLKVAGSSHANFLLEVAASLDAVAQTLQGGGAPLAMPEPAGRQAEPRNGTDGDESAAEAEEEEGGEGEEADVMLFDRYVKAAFEGAGELLKYAAPKPNRHGRKNFMGTEAVYPSIGMECGKSMAAELRRYMAYNVSGPCPDDWPLAQRLMVGGCDPPPRRRCFSRAPDEEGAPSDTPAAPLESPLWTLPEDRRVRWTHYKCKGFACLAGRNGGGKNRGLSKCAECFDLATHEARRWAEHNETAAEFSAERVVALKRSGEIRVGLDFGPGSGTFAAVMRGLGVTVASATLNLGAPFNEVIALRGLLPLYVSLNQRLPFFDNTLDMVHSALFLDGWIHVELLEFVVFDWDRVLRPGGLLWIDRFFCAEGDIEEYVGVFGKLGYVRHLWVVVPKVDKDGGEVFFSAVLEKPHRLVRDWGK